MRKRAWPDSGSRISLRANRRLRVSGRAQGLPDEHDNWELAAISKSARSESPESLVDIRQNRIEQATEGKRNRKRKGKARWTRELNA